MHAGQAEYDEPVENTKPAWNMADNADGRRYSEYDDKIGERDHGI